MLRPDRRQWLKSAAGVPILAALGCGDGGSRPRRGPGILVAGGGLCGLVVLDRLVAAGADARLVEAAPRLGGRILTLREGLHPDLRAEAGAERVRPIDTRTHALIRELGVSFAEYRGEARSALLEMGGKSFRFRRPADLPAEFFAGLSETEKKAAPFGIPEALTLGAEAPAADDRRSGLQWLRDLGLSARGEELLAVCCYHPIERMPAAVFHRIVAGDREAAGGQQAIAGGTDSIVRALARRHEGRIALGAKIVRLDEDASGVTATDAAGKSHRADRAVICLPPRALADLAFGGGRPEALARRLDALCIAHEMKIHLQVPAAVLERPETAGFSLRDRFPRASWLGPESAADGSRVLNFMVFEEEAVQAGKVAARGAGALRDRLAVAVPDLARDATALLWHDWAADPLAGGAFAYAIKPEGVEGGIVKAGRIVFGGSDLSERPGWMEGAVRSAEACVQEVLS